MQTFARLLQSLLYLRSWNKEQTRLMSLTTPLDQYIADHSSPEGDYLYRLFRATHVEILAPQMASGHIQGRLLKFLVNLFLARML